MSNQKVKKIEMLKQPYLLALCLTVALGVGTLQAQRDPGPRGGPAAAGGPVSGLNSDEATFFKQALEHFQEIDSVSGTAPGEVGIGLGPTYNANSCASCHAHPALGGSSPAVNPQVALATLDGANNSVPPFISINGPVREARFISTNPADPNAALDGGVHGLYTIAGRSDAPGCTLAQPDFAAQLASHNVIFRIPTPAFGTGLIENTSDATLNANLASNAAAKAALGIHGKLNHSGNDGTVTRFGWKAQNKSLLIFAGEAYNVEQGVSNEEFPNERAAVAGCVYNDTPEDGTNIVNHDTGNNVGTASDMSSDTVNFAGFLRLTAAPTPATHTASELNGQSLFSRIGCALCHTQSLTTAKSSIPGLSGVTYQPYSDIAVHHMGSNLADGINQGAAGPDEFRTAPLWGLGQRLFFLHDGRTNDLLQAIQAHFSPGNVCVTAADFQQFTANGKTFQPFSVSQVCGSEANGVIRNFNSLSPSQKQDLLNFLRSL
ncbi:MAG TPA: di-heme oxidoredictase family protein [Terriglobales bacterium]|nr:di-heme oxidoredictase family protein [Terriglobales bacterium]